MLNIVGGGAGVGGAFSTHPGIDKLSFTGRSAQGWALTAADSRYDPSCMPFLNP
ncbi:hypothetical protein [Pseudomonas sp. BIC9C]|uniref:hypothetical protein n=1 Tax=Pseudomonas sp. BIC9C TaxID=3078458 RepID=UPI002AD35FF8|nr:hypothetical protein [Pseudomonas sp. BIC9C]